MEDTIIEPEQKQSGQQENRLIEITKLSGFSISGEVSIDFGHILMHLYAL